MNQALSEQSVRLQLAALVGRLGLARTSRETGLSKYQLLTLTSGNRVHRGTLSQAVAALAITSLPTASDIG